MTAIIRPRLIVGSTLQQQINQAIAQAAAHRCPHDYCRLAQWRCNDPGERARAMDVPKPPPVPPDQEALFSLP